MKAPRPRPLIIAAAAVGAALIVWLLFFAVPRWSNPGPVSLTSAAEPAGSEEPSRKIKARLFYVGADGGTLTSLEQDVSFAEEPVDQAREIVRAQLQPAVPPLVSAIPSGTTLRALFLTPRGEAYVDLSREVVAAHPGGSVHELLTVYTIVHALTTNLPAVKSVQLLVDGKEVGTLAGHINLQRPLGPNLEWVQ
jgi:spore germination protein GerM